MALPTFSPDAASRAIGSRAPKPPDRRRRRPAERVGPLVLVAALGAGVAGCSSGAGPPQELTRADGAGEAAVSLGQIQVIATHNSYHQELSLPERTAFDALVEAPGAYERLLAYGHAPLRRQLDEQGVRGIELDLLPDPESGHYAEPAVRRATGLGPWEEPSWAEPGTKVLHVVDLDRRRAAPSW